ncbi:Coagulin domain containing protein [Asbolus verrucosus]|uniref:Coagulin domain containing protein n=1 Tax=Asbolus verrucosus TaxID=1661398 RepID=A0A482WD84_ASBVE|nr:Coagulin domain containing protein [Asbolus verrucosus]
MDQLYACRCLSYGFDSGGDQGACGRQYRAGRMHRPPCDLTGGYCTSAGSAYPWHAVKRFVRENQGLMRRMYGDQRHGQVLKAELDDVHLQPVTDFYRFDDRKMYAKQEFDFNLDNEVSRDGNEPRYLRDEDISNDDVLNTKFVYSEEPSISIKLADLRTAPHFRPTTHKTTTAEVPKTTTTTEEVTTETETSTIELTTDTTTGQNAKTDTSTNANPTEPVTNDNNKSGAVLFQDMEDQNKNSNKVQVNYQMRGVNACPVKEEVVAPFWANNTRGEVLALLNMYPFEQYVHWEKCTHEHRQMYCRDGCRCEQQYRLHRLLAYDPNNECRGIFSDWFRFPSCCVCKCYSIPPAEFRVTSRSPRAFNEFQGFPDWYRRKNEAISSSGDHG